MGVGGLQTIKHSLYFTAFQEGQLLDKALNRHLPIAVNVHPSISSSGEEEERIKQNCLPVQTFHSEKWLHEAQRPQ